MDAVRAGHLAIVRYLCEPPAGGGGAPLCAPTAAIYFEAAGAGHWHVVEWAAAAGVPWDMSSVVMALHRLSQRTVAQRAGYVRLVDDGIWHCSPALRELVGSWPCADDTGGAVPVNQPVPQEHAIRRLYSVFSGFLGCDNAPPTPGNIATVDMFFGLVGRALASGP
ncbi:ankyrin repeat protein [Pandoravirus inopinatum]|uniref:Ankyrin repeat protein n=1 Tax=Pandoravirus inopinatum TaxID=1605721 RepID=A0A0B5J554_9VIRU|nr:ankyrin repeat protein [Pandoravirus inopinatum]AJF96745.1 ankyrin repeat protein [Pandoravirus inopinatum]